MGQPATTLAQPMGSQDQLRSSSVLVFLVWSDCSLMRGLPRELQRVWIICSDTCLIFWGNCMPFMWQCKTRNLHKDLIEVLMESKTSKIMIYTLLMSNWILFQLMGVCWCLQVTTVPSAQSLHLLDFSFSDFDLSDTETTLATIRMFIDLKLIQNFQMKYTVRTRLHSI